MTVNREEVIGLKGSNDVKQKQEQEIPTLGFEGESQHFQEQNRANRRGAVLTENQSFWVLATSISVSVAPAAANLSHICNSNKINKFMGMLYFIQIL